MKYSFVILFALLSLTSSLLGKDFPKGSPHFYDSHTKGLAEARRTGKPLIIVVSAEWCPPCQSNVKKVYPSKEIAAYHDKFIWVYLDSDKPENRAGIAPLGVKGIPHIEYLSSSGQRLGNTRGALPASKMAGILKEIVAKHPAPKKGVAPDPKRESGSAAPSPGGGTDGEALLIPELR